MKPRVVHLIAAARPNFMKVAPLWHALAAAEDFTPVLVHTGQHYDANMAGDIFDDLKLQTPDFSLGVGGGNHGEQTGRVMIAYEAVALAERPDWIIVVGDVNATLACALVGAKLGIRVAHLESGLRSGDRTMPEEINRLATDAISDVLWTPSPDADENLAAEGVDAAKVTRVGNIMLDSFEMVRPTIEAAGEAEALGLTPGGYAVATLHRPANVDTEDALTRLVEAIEAARSMLPIVFPVHPRTAAKLDAFGLRGRLEAADVTLVDPLPYVRFMSLVVGAAAIVTDSGGLQEETTYLGIPCLTLRPNTERPITISEGTNRLVTPETLAAALREALEHSHQPARPEFWDGMTAARCLADLRQRSADPVVLE